MILVALPLGAATIDVPTSLVDILPTAAAWAGANIADYHGSGRSLLPLEDLPSAFSLQSIAFNLGSIVGPGLSGIIIAYYGQEYTYYLNAVSFAAVIVALALMGHVSQPAPQNALSIRNSLGRPSSGRG